MPETVADPPSASTTSMQAVAYQALRLLLTTSHHSTPDALVDIMQDAFGLLGAERAVPLLIDYDQRVLGPLPLDGEPAGDVVPVDGSPEGEAFTEGRTQVQRAGDRVDAWIPLLDGTDRLGVLLVRFVGAAAFEPEVLAHCEVMAALVAELLVARNLYCDLFERRRRTLPMTLAAELQWRLLPPLTLVTERLAITGVLAPSYAVAGDAFDYAVNGAVAHFAIFDAMGHSLEAALMASVAVSAFRAARRAGMSLEDNARSVDRAIRAQFGDDRFVTGVIAELDLTDGTYRWVNAGHPPVLLVRGGRVHKQLDQNINPPFGLLNEGPLGATEQLEPADRLISYTDGVTEARTIDGEFFGVERLVEFVRREEEAGRAAAETMRRLALAISAHHSGVLEDDATTVMVNWFGPGGSAEAARRQVVGDQP